MGTVVEGLGVKVKAAPQRELLVMPQYQEEEAPPAMLLTRPPAVSDQPPVALAPPQQQPQPEGTLPPEMPDAPMPANGSEVAVPGPLPQDMVFPEPYPDAVLPIEKQRPGFPWGAAALGGGTLLFLIFTSRKKKE